MNRRRTLGYGGAAAGTARPPGDTAVRPATLHVVWPGGEKTSVSIAPETLEVRVTLPG